MNKEEYIDHMASLAMQGFISKMESTFSKPLSQCYTWAYDVAENMWQEKLKRSNVVEDKFNISLERFLNIEECVGLQWYIIVENGKRHASKSPFILEWDNEDNLEWRCEDDIYTDMHYDKPFDFPHPYPPFLELLVDPFNYKMGDGQLKFEVIEGGEIQITHIPSNPNSNPSKIGYKGIEWYIMVKNNKRYAGNMEFIIEFGDVCISQGMEYSDAFLNPYKLPEFLDLIDVSKFEDPEDGQLKVEIDNYGKVKIEHLEIS